MANEKYVKMLRQGVTVWNEWKEKNPDVKAELAGADLRGMSLREANLQEADLREANLQKADLQKANLRGAHLEEARLQETDLWSADLRGADLQGANLQYTTLTGANFTKANITGAQLYSTARDDWIIDGVICNYVYFSWEGRERTPKDRDFEPGEFEELYKQIPTFKYYFEQGFTPLDPLIMDRVVQALNERQPEVELKLDSFHSRGRPHAVFTVLHKERVETVRQQVKDDYERRLAALESRQEQFMQMLSMIGSGTTMLQAIRDGFTLKHAIPTELTQQIIVFLVSLPGVDSEEARRGWMFNAGLDAPLHQQIQFRGASLHFAQLLVQTAVSYGTLRTGKHALEAILEAARDVVGQEKQARCDELLGNLRWCLK